MDKLINQLSNSNLEQSIKLLPKFLEYSALGVAFLIDCLSDRHLEMRAKAYELLKHVNTVEAKQAVSQGILLNPGDIIYSVYQSGKWFNDESYLLFDGVNYLESIYLKVYGNENFDEGDAMCRSKRIFCYLDREQAEAAAEMIHRQQISTHGIGICGFNWERENPYFDPQQWCIDHRLPYKNDWDSKENFQIVQEVERLVRQSNNKALLDKFKRSRYTYHLDFIDEWLKENKANFDYQPGDWNSLYEFFDYLELSQNIELLSKFWKDGVGHFAFVHEEIVQRQVNLKIGKKLGDELALDRERVTLIARPKSYPEQASKYLVGIIESEHSKPKHKLRAYELLSDFDTEISQNAIAKGIYNLEVESIFDLGEEIELDSIRNSWDGNPI